MKLDIYGKAFHHTVMSKIMSCDPPIYFKQVNQLLIMLNNHTDQEYNQENSYHIDIGTSVHKFLLQQAQTKTKCNDKRVTYHDRQIKGAKPARS